VKREPLYTDESLAAAAASRHIVHDKARRELGHDPRPLAETIRDTCAWLDANGMLHARPRAAERSA